MKYNMLKCCFCDKEVQDFNMSKHENSCHLNPLNLRNCLICSKPIKDYRNSKGSCSKGCANTLFRSGKNHPNLKPNRYRTTCFINHKKKCVICKESNIVEVHHLDENSKNNEPSNLIPMCPTHHKYWHSKFKYLIEETVLDYIKNWNKNRM